MQVEPIILVVILLLGIIVLSFLVTSSKGQTEDWKLDLRKRSNSIRNRIGKADTIAKKQLLIESDKLLDHTLMNLKVPGRNLGDRLKASRGKMDKDLYQKVWNSHKARNSLVHELDFKISDDDIKLHVKNLLQAINKLTD